MAKCSIYKSKLGKNNILTHYDTYVQELECDMENVFVQTSFGKTHVLVSGPEYGKPLFILQGGNSINPMTLSWFLPLLKHYRVYAPDTIGHPGYSDQNRISLDDGFAKWVNELMGHFQIKKNAFIGPSYGGGIILRLAAHLPEKITCAVLVAPAGIKLGSKLTMIKKILLPLILFKITSSEKYLHFITDAMSNGTMKNMDKSIIADIFKFVKLEQEMPKLTNKKELKQYDAPTFVISGEQDIFFPAAQIMPVAMSIIPNLIAIKTYEMAHFPDNYYLKMIQNDIHSFLHTYY